MTTIREHQIAAIANVLKKEHPFLYSEPRATELATVMWNAACDPAANPEQSFANAPETITSLRASRNANGKDWTVRDCLIDALRDYYRGEVFKDLSGVLPTCAIIIVGSVDTNGGTSTSHYQRSDDAYQLRGLIVEAMTQIEVKRRS